MKGDDTMAQVSFRVDDNIKAKADCAAMGSF